MWHSYNANPDGKNVGDCVIRSICAAEKSPWEDTYIGICAKGLLLHDLPSANRVWGAYLRQKGYTRHALPNTCPDCYTVADFTADHPTGTYVLALPNHVVCVRDGDWIDTWDSGDETPIYYWTKEG